MRKIPLATGGVLLYEQTDRFKSEYFTVNFLLPLERETVTAYALLPSLLCRGSRLHPTQQLLSKRCEELYALAISADVRKCGEALGLTFIVSAISDSFAFDGTEVLKEGIGLLGEILCDPYLPDGGFDKSYIRREKDELRDTLRSKIDSKSAYCLERAVGEMCASEPFGISVGYEEDIEGITGETLLSLYRELTEKYMPVYTYVGASGSEKIEGFISSSLPLHGSECNVGRPEKAKAPEKISIISEKMNINQSKVAMCYRMDKTLFDSDFYKFSCFSALFGDSPTSRLFANVREKKSLCYYCRPVGYSVKGIYIVTAGIERNNRDALISAVEEQLDDLKSGNISDEELMQAKKSLKNSYTEIPDSASAISAWYFNRFLAGRTDSPMQAAELIDGVTKEDIAEMAASLTPDTYFILEGSDEA